MKHPAGKCRLSSCLGHPAQTTVETQCVKCQGKKFVPDPCLPLTPYSAGPPIPLILPYTCALCRAGVTGREVSPDQKAQRARMAVARAAQAASRAGQPGFRTAQEAF